MSSAVGQARDNLQKIEHFIVLMLENRSFDQMLDYLEFEEFGSHDLDGLKPAEDKRLTNKPPRTVANNQKRAGQKILLFAGYF
jgi:hypothetical protein